MLKITRTDRKQFVLCDQYQKSIYNAIYNVVHLYQHDCFDCSNFHIWTPLTLLTLRDNLELFIATNLINDHTVSYIQWMLDTMEVNIDLDTKNGIFAVMLTFGLPQQSISVLSDSRYRIEYVPTQYNNATLNDVTF
jgi:hypothetical protein